VQLQGRCDDKQPLKIVDGSDKLDGEDKQPVLSIAEPVHSEHKLEIPNQTRQPSKSKSRLQPN